MGWVGKGAFLAWICLRIGCSGEDGRKWVWWGVFEQERRAEVGLEAGVSQCMKGTLSKVRDYRLYPESKRTQLKGFK